MTIVTRIFSPIVLHRNGAALEAASSFGQNCPPSFTAAATSPIQMPPSFHYPLYWVTCDYFLRYYAVVSVVSFPSPSFRKEQKRNELTGGYSNTASVFASRTSGAVFVVVLYLGLPWRARNTRYPPWLLLVLFQRGFNIREYTNMVVLVLSDKPVQNDGMMHECYSQLRHGNAQCLS